ncbi:hypothetical protein BDI4_710014 [Burkholderia diffusa]|nr:hypothetical protein BDI4_710014 [Burkholderia diffusa]
MRGMAPLRGAAWNNWPDSSVYIPSLGAAGQRDNGHHEVDFPSGGIVPRRHAKENGNEDDAVRHRADGRDRAARGRRAAAGR